MKFLSILGKVLYIVFFVLATNIGNIDDKLFFYFGSLNFLILSIITDGILLLKEYFKA